MDFVEKQTRREDLSLSFSTMTVAFVDTLQCPERACVLQSRFYDFSLLVLLPINFKAKRVVI